MTDARYARIETLLRIVLRMEAARDGVTLAEIGEIAGVERRTAERIRDALLRAIPQIEEGDLGPPKRWRLAAPVLSRSIQPDLDDLAALHRARLICVREGDAATAEALGVLSEKMQAGLNAAARRRLAPDLEALEAAEAVVRRPGPREAPDPAIMAVLRDAILAGIRVSCDYRVASSGKVSRGQELSPVAIIVGDGRQYLLAHSAYADDLRLFRLTNIQTLEPLPQPASLPEGFALADWLAGSFGVWREAAVEVVWRFLPEVADEAAGWQFHPRQQVWTEPDGSLTVSFTAGGLREMCEHLFRWGDQVRIVAPPALRDTFAARLDAARRALEVSE